MLLATTTLLHRLFVPITDLVEATLASVEGHVNTDFNSQLKASSSSSAPEL
jgi:hypothetical protein